MKLLGLIQDIEAARNTRVLILAASNLELDLLPALYDVLRSVGRTDRLDVLMFCRGGVVNAARRIALLLHDFTDQLTLIIPDRCESSGTIVTLAAHNVIAGPVAIFSPIDPLLMAGNPDVEGAPMAISAQDARLFGEMTQAWFGVASKDVGETALSALTQSVFPTTLTSFYRSCTETREIALELRARAAPDESETDRSRIIDTLLYGYHSHAYALRREDLAAIGLPITTDPVVEDIAWQIAHVLRGVIGAGVRKSIEDEWIDTVIASREGLRTRHRTPSGLAPSWDVGIVE
ncbi:MAG: SDH family Clp fold serine proteinase [Brevundimonas sp.]|jgi:hypothetical protein